MFDDLEQFRREIDLLQDAEFVERLPVRGEVAPLVNPRGVNLLGRKRWTKMPRVARLPAPATFAWASRFRSRSGGLTMSLDGGLEEVDEFFLNLASCASNSAIRANNGAVASSIKRRTSTSV